jgi:CheY-like chemotaxis protein
MIKKILLAEDDYDDQEFFLKILHTRTDAAILQAVENGEEVIQFLDNTTDLPDVIILDQNMPKQNGLQTLSLLKRNKRYAHMPVVIYSTYINEMLETQSISLGAIMAVAKPYDKKGYNGMIDKILTCISSVLPGGA